MKLTVLVPFFNEENTLRESVMGVINELPESKIILIDDKSSDNSLNIAKELGREFQNIKILENPSNLGKGAALKLSKDHIDTSHVIIHDADLEYFPKDIKNLFIKALDCPEDMILGSRFIGSKERKNLYRRTLIANKVMSKFFSLVYGVNISDIATCYKLMPAEYFKNIELLENGFSIEIEIVAKFVKGNKKVHELPISYIGRSYAEGKKIKVTDGFKYIFNTLRYKFT